MKTDSSFIRQLLDHAGDCPEGSTIQELAPGLILLTIASDPAKGQAYYDLSFAFYFDNRYQTECEQIVREVGDDIWMCELSHTEVGALQMHPAGWEFAFSGPKEFSGLAPCKAIRLSDLVTLT